ncbi:MAG TPA: hypothetical protein VFN61_08310 [Acidimicrobiales bacterium]|nr:hypothetical protein [Acidimicrobiales bacterium]
MTAQGFPAGPPQQTGSDFDRAAAWGVRSTHEPRWPAVVAVGAAMALQWVLPDTVITGLGPRWFIPSLEGAFALALLAASPDHSKQNARLRMASIAMIGIVNVANLVSLGELVVRLVNGTTHAAGRALVFASLPIWLTNVIVFGLWYWELDRGGPAARLRAEHRAPDFLFPQMSTAGAKPGWAPNFVDYLYTSFTNATAFSPTDTMPLTTWAKLLMMLQSFASLVTVALVFSRAINILG